MKTIYILLTRSDTCISKMIHFATADKYTHVSISFDKSLQPMYSFSRKFIYMPLPAGLREEPLEVGFYKKYDYIPCALYELQVPDEVYDCAKMEVAKMYTASDTYRFNVIGLVLCKLNIAYSRERYRFCSEFVSDILNKSNAVELPKEPCLMRPNDYSSLPGMICKYEGRLDGLIQHCKCAYG